MNYEPNLGIYDMRRDTEELPKSLANKLNINICMKGGGGSTVTTGVPEEWKPQVTKGLNISLKQLEDQMSGEKDIIIFYKFYHLLSILTCKSAKLVAFLISSNNFN